MKTQSKGLWLCRCRKRRTQTRALTLINHQGFMSCWSSWLTVCFSVYRNIMVVLFFQAEQKHSYHNSRRYTVWVCTIVKKSYIELCLKIWARDRDWMSEWVSEWAEKGEIETSKRSYYLAKYDIMLLFRTNTCYKIIQTCHNKCGSMCR